MQRSSGAILICKLSIVVTGREHNDAHDRPRPADHHRQQAVRQRSTINNPAL
jgi:hypothetical protein